jgi:hypothetical protein
MNCARQLRVWTPEQRAEQSRKMRERKIWLASTGPKTLAGKQKSSRNAYKHGGRCGKHKNLRILLKKYALWTKLYNNIYKNPSKVTNELIDFMSLLHEVIMLETEFWRRKYLFRPPRVEKG